MSSVKQHPYPFIIAVGCALLLTSCDGRLTRNVEPTILEAQGSLSLITVPAGPERPLDGRTRWSAGEKLVTGADGTAAFFLLPGVLLQVEPNSELILEELTLRKDGYAIVEAMRRSLRLQLRSGVVFLATQIEERSSHLALVTAHGRIAAARGGLCRLESTPGKTRLTSVRGSFTFSSSEGGSVEVEAGYFHEWPASSAAPRPAELDAQAQEEIENSLTVERKLLDLQGRAYGRRFPWRESRNRALHKWTQDFSSLIHFPGPADRSGPASSSLASAAAD